jgi:hypothetical protein
MSSLRPCERDRFDGVVDSLKEAVRSVYGKEGIDSPYDRIELHPGYAQLLHHLDRALHWAEEMQWIIKRELSGKKAA